MIKNQTSLFVFNNHNHLEVVITEYNKDMHKLSPMKDIYQFDSTDPFEEKEEAYDYDMDKLLEELE